MRKLFAILGAAVLVASVAGTAYADDFKRGKKVFRKCKACHEVGPDAANKIGPQLTDIVGRKAGAVKEFTGYSDALKAKAEGGLVWTEDNLRAFLDKPKEFIEGTAMNFPGLRKDKDLNGIIIYLKANGQE